jgi:hypothetical protein
MPGVQRIGTAVVAVTPRDYFELIARQTSGATKDVPADEAHLVRHRGGGVIGRTCRSPVRIQRRLG